MVYEKIDESNIKETKQVEVVFNIDLLEQKLVGINNRLTRIDEQKARTLIAKTELEELIAEALKLGVIKTSEVDVSPVKVVK